MVDGRPLKCLCWGGKLSAYGRGVAWLEKSSAGEIKKFLSLMLNLVGSEVKTWYFVRKAFHANLRCSYVIVFRSVSAQTVLIVIARLSWGRRLRIF